MAPKEPSLSLLFHPKKNKKNAPKPGPNGASPRKNPAPGTTSRPKTASASPAHTPKAEEPSSQEKADDEDAFEFPNCEYQEYKVMSSALNGWKFDVMKFDSRKVVDLSSWQQPVKLNRKDLRRDDPESTTTGVPLRPMLGLDGQQVFGVDGKPVMVDAEGKPVTENGAGSSNAKGKGGLNGANNKKKFQKKTKQVFIVPEHIRALRREERYPWVLEDASGQELWVAQLEDVSKAETHGFFMPAATGDIFKFVPSHRWYRFQKKLQHDLPTDTQTVESAYQKSQKRDPTAWLRQRNGKGPSAATAAAFKAEAEGRILGGGAIHSAGTSYGPGGRRLKAVDNGGGLFGDDDEDGDSKRRRDREFGGEGDLDENVFEEEFADDDEHMEVDGKDDDEEAKELEERLKKEYKNANKTREGYIDESEEEDEQPVNTQQGKAMKKMLKTREGDAYDSEDEENPYASSAEEEEEEEVPPPAEGPAVMQQPQQIKPKQEPTESSIPNAASPAPPTQNGTQTSLPPSPKSPTSPSSPSGHSLVAKRATSPPKAPKLKTSTNGSRAGSPLASGSRATSPVTGVPGSRVGSPTSNGQHNKKRKADDSAPSPSSPTGPSAAGQQPKAKKRKNTIPPQGPLEESMLIDWLRNTPNASTRECIQHFTPYLSDEKEKSRFTGLVKELASLKNGKLVLKPNYRGSATPAPMATQ